MKRFVQTMTTTGLALFMIAARANAATVTLGAGATLTSIPHEDETVGDATKINYGIFSILCNSCTPQNAMGGAIFTNFTFNLLITDLFDGATSRLMRTSSDQAVFRDAREIMVNSVPLRLESGAIEALSGKFGTTVF